MDEKTEPVGHIDPVEHEVHNKNTSSEAGSSSSNGLLETVRDCPTLINSISTEFEKLLESNALVKAMESVDSKLTDEVEELKEKLQSVFVDETCMNGWKKDFEKSLQKILELVNELKQHTKLYNSVDTIVERVRSGLPMIAVPQLQVLDYRCRKHDGADVFICHSGVQKNFARQLYQDLSGKGVACFLDENPNSLPFAEDFPTHIFKTIEACIIAVVVLSRDFIRSKWPMKELVTLKKSAKTLLPIFFKIIPKELSIEIPEWKDLPNETRVEWRDALTFVRRKRGFQFLEVDNEVVLRENIVKEICRFRRIPPPKLLEFDPVGIEEQVRKVKELLDIEGDEPALAVIVYGVRGMGTSTVAASVVQSLDWPSLRARGLWFCWVEIDEKTSDKISHTMKLQNNMLRDLGEELQGVPEVRDRKDGLCRIKEALSNKFVLVFINNVFDKEYVEHLLPKCLPYGKHTKLRIIITSPDTNVTVNLGDGFKYQEYEVKRLSDADSESLLLKTILKDEDEEVGSDEKHMIKLFSAACKGVPLLLSRYGKHLKVDRSKDTYNYVLEELAEGNLGNLDSFWDEDVGGKLMFQYDKIKNEKVKEAFLDICVYFNRWDWDVVAKIVKNSTLQELRWRLLVSKSDSKVVVQDILLGIGRKEGRCTRFLNYNELSDALEDNSDVLKKVTGISLVNDDIKIESTKLEAMPRLELLMLGDRVTLHPSPCNRAFKNMRYVRVGDTDFPFKGPFTLDKLRDLPPR